MMFFAFIPFLLLGLAQCGHPEVSCLAPRSPEHGQAFLHQDGSVVKFVCLPGYVLKGKEMVRCIDGQWEDLDPTCVEVDGLEDSDNLKPEPSPPVLPPRPLFSWGSEIEDKNETEVNSTDSEMPLSDEARVRLLMYPRRRTRVITTRVHTGRLQTESEEDEKKRSKDETNSGSTTIHVESPPSVLYVRRTVTPGKSSEHDVEVVSLPRAAVSLDDKAQSDEALRQLYWYYHNYPRSVIDYRSGAPVAMSLTESQLAWINSLHPELRDQYLKDLYIMRADETVEGQRALAYIRNYEDAYNYAYYSPYMRQPVSLIMEDPITKYDYTCHESGHPFVKAPKFRNMHIARYDHRQNPNTPRNHYLVAIYRCNPGYVMLDTRFTELYCSKKHWTGVKPVCVRRG